VQLVCYIPPFNGISFSLPPPMCCVNHAWLLPLYSPVHIDAAHKILEQKVAYPVIQVVSCSETLTLVYCTSFYMVSHSSILHSSIIDLFQYTSSFHGTHVISQRLKKAPLCPTIGG
jgi:hypothetical protein